MRKLVIVPAYNEAANIHNLILRLKLQRDYDVIVINDCSHDITSMICKKEGIKVLDLPCNLGIGGAVQTGYRYAAQNNYDIAIQVDGDGQHNPAFLSSLVAPIEKGEADLVIGSRFIENKGFQSSFMRRFGIKFFSSLIKIITGKEITDPTSGFRACGKEVIYYFSDHYPVDYPEPESIVSLSRLGYRVTEIPVVMHERKGGESSIKKLKSVYYMIKVTLAILIDAIKEDEKTVKYLKDKVKEDEKTAKYLKEDKKTVKYLKEKVN